MSHGHQVFRASGYLTLDRQEAKSMMGKHTALDLVDEEQKHFLFLVFQTSGNKTRETRQCFFQFPVGGSSYPPMTLTAPGGVSPASGLRAGR